MPLTSGLKSGIIVTNKRTKVHFYRSYKLLVKQTTITILT
jgi:hypothetical protein